MARADRITGIVVLALGLAWAFMALHLPLYEAGAPGPGFVPLLVALLMAALGAGLAAPGREHRDAQPAWPDKEGGQRVLVAFGVLAGYTILVMVVGFMASSALFLGAMFRLWGGYGWWKASLLAIVLAASAFAIFQLWLDVPLPPGALF